MGGRDSQLGTGISAEQRDLVSRWKVRADTQGGSLVYHAHPGTPIPTHRETGWGMGGRGRKRQGPRAGKTGSETRNEAGGMH